MYVACNVCNIFSINELSSKEYRLETLQNQILRHVAEVFKKVSIETLKTETYTSSLHVHLNMLQNKITLHSWINNWMQEIRQACELICAHLMRVNHVISCLFIIKKVMLLNISIQEDTRIQMRYRWLFLSATTSINNSIIIAQYHKN